MTWIKKQSDDTEISHNFVAPGESKDLNREVLFPLAQVQAPAYAAAIAVTINQMSNFVQPVELTGNATINLTIADQVTAGARLNLKLDADASNRTVTLGTGFDAGLASIVVAASKIAFLSFEYDGTAFVPVCSIPAVAG